MWSSKKLFRRRTALFAAGLLGISALAGCGFTPLYGRGGDLNGTATAFAYADPNSRVEQIIYENMGLRLGKTETAGAPLITISASSSKRSIGRSSTGLTISTLEATITATATVSGLPQKGVTGGVTAEPFSIKRTASATYSKNGQTLADNQAYIDAERRAAKAVSESLVLLIKARLR